MVVVQLEETSVTHLQKMKKAMQVKAIPKSDLEVPLPTCYAFLLLLVLWDVFQALFLGLVHLLISQIHQQVLMCCQQGSFS